MPDGPFYLSIGLLILGGVLLTIVVVRSRRRRRGAPVALSTPYAGQTQQPPAGYPPEPGTPTGAGTPTAPGTPTGAGYPPVPGASAGFPSAAALFSPPKQPARPEPPTVDPGTYPSMPSGLAGHDGPEQAMPSGRPSGLPAVAPEPVPMAPSAPGTSPSGTSPSGTSPSGTSPSGLPRRVPPHTEPPADPGLTQRLQLPNGSFVHEGPAGPQPIYPTYPPQGAQQWASPAPQPGQLPAEGFRHAPAEYFGQAQAARARHAQPPSEEPGHFGRHGYAEPEAAEPMPRHSHPEEAAAGRHWQPDSEPFSQPAYRPAHEAYPQEQATHPADWPPLPR